MTGMIDDSTGMIDDSTGMIGNSTGMIDDDTGLITKTNDAEHAASGRKKRSRERGKDNKPRNFPLHTIKNLPQFRNKSHEEVRQYVLEKKGVDIGSNINFGKMMLWVLIGLLAIACGVGLAKWMQKKKEERDY